MDQDKLKCDTNKHENQCDVENSVSSNTQKGSEVHSTDLQDRAKMLEFWSEEYKVNVNCKWKDETLLLMCLAMYESDPCIMRLVEIECDINATNILGSSPLHLAVKRPTLIVAIELIKRGANINAQDKRKYTPLHVAIMENHEAMCMLLYYGADIYARDCDKISLFRAAIDVQHFDSFDILVDYYDYEAFYEVINFINHNPVNVEYLLRAKNSHFFKLLWPYINHGWLTDYYKPFLSMYLEHCYFPTHEWFECLQLILQSDSIVDLIEHHNSSSSILRKTFVSLLLHTFHKKQIEINKRMSTIFMVLSSGTKICLEDFNCVFKFFGFDEELEAFIYAADYEAVYHSDLFSFVLLPFILAFSNDFSTNTIISLLKNQIMYHPFSDTSENHVINVLRFFSFNSNAKAQLLKTCYKYISKHIKRVLDEIPEVPSLLELSRNQIYLSIRNSYKVKRPYHFHDAVKNLLLPQKLKDVIIFKRPIY